MAKRNNPFSTKVELDTENMAVNITIREKNDKGDFVEVDSNSFATSTIHADLADQVLLYGYSKLLQDRSSDTDVGPDKLAAMQEVADQLAAGNWERERRSGAPTVSAEVEALAAIKSCSVADIQKSLRKYTKEQKEKIFANEAVKAKADEIRASRSTDDETIDLEAFAA